MAGSRSISCFLSLSIILATLPAVANKTPEMNAFVAPLSLHFRLNDKYTAKQASAPSDTEFKIVGYEFGKFQRRFDRVSSTEVLLPQISGFAFSFNYPNATMTLHLPHVLKVQITESKVLDKHNKIPKTRWVEIETLDFNLDDALATNIKALSHGRDHMISGLSIDHLRDLHALMESIGSSEEGINKIVESSGLTPKPMLRPLAAGIVLDLKKALDREKQEASITLTTAEFGGNYGVLNPASRLYIPLKEVQVASLEQNHLMPIHQNRLWMEQLHHWIEELRFRRIMKYGVSGSQYIEEYSPTFSKPLSDIFTEIRANLESGEWNLDFEIPMENISFNGKILLGDKKGEAKILKRFQKTGYSLEITWKDSSQEVNSTFFNINQDEGPVAIEAIGANANFVVALARKSQFNTNIEFREDQNGQMTDSNKQRVSESLSFNSPSFRESYWEPLDNLTLIVQARDIEQTLIKKPTDININNGEYILSIKPISDNAFEIQSNLRAWDLFIGQKDYTFSFQEKTNSQMTSGLSCKNLF